MFVTSPGWLAAGTRPKPTFALAACIAFVALVAGCGGDDEPSTRATTGTSSSEASAEA